MKIRTNIAANNVTVELCEAIRPKDLDFYEATVFVDGTFSGGTVQLLASPDGGTTKTVLRDVAGTLVNITANDVYNIRLGNGNKNADYILLYADITGATTPNLNVTVFDNR